MTWMHRFRLRVLGLLVAGALAVIAMVSIPWVPLWPALGVAVAAVALVFNRAASRLDGPTCFACGADLRAQPLGEHGVICPHCGSISDVLPRVAASAKRSPPGAAPSRAPLDRT
jgi:hypothetical protein